MFNVSLTCSWRACAGEASKEGTSTGCEPGITPEKIGDDTLSGRREQGGNRIELTQTDPAENNQNWGILDYLTIRGRGMEALLKKPGQPGGPSNGLIALSNEGSALVHY